VLIIGPPGWCLTLLIQLPHFFSNFFSNTYIHTPIFCLLSFSHTRSVFLSFLCLYFHLCLADTLYEGGFFKGTLLLNKWFLDSFTTSLSLAAHLYFPKEYPLRPPRMRFVTEIWHPNIDQNGDGESTKKSYGSFRRTSD
jgi:hypothetical protein